MTDFSEKGGACRILCSVFRGKLPHNATLGPSLNSLRLLLRELLVWGRSFSLERGNSNLINVQPAAENLRHARHLLFASGIGGLGIET
jgi:hypothetical protein